MLATSHRPFFVFLAAVLSLGGSYRTTNFTVEAPTGEIAEQIGTTAERCRKETALEWLGREMPPWTYPCAIRVKIVDTNPGGATTSAFRRGHVLQQNIELEGPLDRLLAGVLPHEVTHALMAQHFGQPVPRWFDEGAAILAEDSESHLKQEAMACKFVSEPNRAISLHQLFQLSEYPQDLTIFFAEAFSVTRFLLERRDRRTLLNFVADGLHDGWDKALQSNYRIFNVEELEKAWLADLKHYRLAGHVVLLTSWTAHVLYRLADMPCRTVPTILETIRKRGLAPSLSGACRRLRIVSYCFNGRRFTRVTATESTSCAFDSIDF